VVRKREADSDGVPPSHLRLVSPYDRDARWSAKGDELFWCGYKIHLTESCETTLRTRPRHLSGPTEPDHRRGYDLLHRAGRTATAGIQQRLAEHQVKPDEHYLDACYPSADLVAAAAHENSKRHGAAGGSPQIWRHRRPGGTRMLLVDETLAHVVTDREELADEPMIRVARRGLGGLYWSGLLVGLVTVGSLPSE
jgi:hypothetical protein